MEYLIQNFNLVSFSLGISFFLIVSAIGQFVTSYIKVKQTRKKANQAQAELERLQDRLKMNREEIRDYLQKETKE